jgi:uncharacterized protein (TIGR03000 family)
MRRDLTFSLLTFVAVASLAAGTSSLQRALGQEGSGTRYVVPARPREARVQLVVTLPADAVLEIESVRMDGTGDKRRFVSPPLAVGVKYTYNLKATWKEGGKQVVREKKVPVRAGEEVVVDMRKDDAKKTEPGAKGTEGSSTKPAEGSPKK